jgi:phosphatidylinositol-3-phosphatase
MKSNQALSALSRLGVALIFAFGLFVSVSAVAQVPRSSHVVLVIEENTSFNTAAANMPWLASQGNANGHATNFISDTSGSLMDYLWLMSGSCHSSANCTLPAGTHDFGCSGDSCASSITDDNLFREMDRSGITWRVYAQSYTAAGGTVTTPDLANGTFYYRRHNPATWYDEVLTNANGSQARVVDFSQFAVDLANGTLPEFSLIVPDGLHDAHDGTPAQADAFLSANLTLLLQQPFFQPGGDGMLIITFDNGDFDIAGQVYTAVIGPKVTPHTVSAVPYKHENTLRTLLDAMGIAAVLGQSANVSAMNDFFASTGSVNITSPAQNATTGTQVLVTATASEPSAQISQLQIWDDTLGQKLGVVNGSSINQSFTLAPGFHRLIVEDMSVTYQVLHKSSVDLTVSAVASGVTITSPTQNATTGSQVLVTAMATESSAQISQLQVWDDTMGQKLAVVNGSSIKQTFTLAPGFHRLIVEDMSVTYQVLHKSNVDITVVADGVTITSPTQNATTGSQVLVTATARESSAQISQMQVWDDTMGQKLAVINGSSVNQTFTLSPGFHRLIVEDISVGTYQVLHKASVGITVAP